MRPLAEQDHYEILEVSRDASDDEIERAFRMALAVYASDSLAGYSVFGAGEADAIRQRIETAYRALTDPETRGAYDAMLAGAPLPVAAHTETSVLDEPVVLVEFEHRPERNDRREASRPGSEAESLDEADGEFDGGRLRRLRIDRGLELEDISGITKINPAYLRFIEENRYAELPAPVYVRGFVAAYADCVGLDAKRVATSYMRNFSTATGRGSRGRSSVSR